MNRAMCRADNEHDRRPEVSIVMANYNGSGWLADAIRSVQAQTLGDWELLIADDASTDDSLPIMQAAASLDSRIVVLPGERNQGPSAARNRAFAEARGKRVAILDSDDALEPQRLERLVESANRDDAKIVADDLLIVDASGMASPRTLLALTKKTEYNAIDIVKQSGTLGYLKPMFDRSVIDTLRYDERLRVGEDFDLLLRTVVRHARVVVYPEMGYRYREHRGSLSKGAAGRALEGMISADQRFLAEHRIEGPLLTEMQRRGRALRTRLHWERVKTSLRERRFLRAAGGAVRHPRIASHLLGLVFRFTRPR